MIRPRSFNKDYLWLLTGTILIYIVLLSMQVMLTYDFSEQYFPWRFFVTLAIKNGELPLWNPYELGGLPIHADPQSGAWYPFLYLHAFLFGKYTLYSAFIELFLTLYLASIGFYKLCRHFSISALTAIMAGIMYASCGFFIGNMQHFTYVISGAFIPFVFLYYFRIFDNARWIDAIKLGLAVFFILSGGYPAFLIISFYILITITIIKFIQIRDLQKLFKISGHFFISAFVFISCSAVILYSMYSIFPFTTRGGGVSLDFAMVGPFSFKAFWSFVFPFATINNGEYLGTDISMANGYFGIIFLLFFFASFFFKGVFTKYRLFYILGFLCLFIAVGKDLPFRAFLYDHFPLMDLFRFPSTFRVFFMVFFMLIAAAGIDQFLSSSEKSKKAIAVFYTAGILVVGITILAFLKAERPFISISTLFTDFDFFRLNAKLYHLVFFQGVIQTLIILSCIIYFKIMPVSSYKKFFVFIILLDCLITANLNMPFTGYNVKFKAADIQKKLDSTPKGLQVNTSVALKNSIDDYRLFYPIYLNVNIHKKEIAIDGYNVFVIKAYDKFTTTEDYKKIIENKFYFLTEKAQKDSSTIAYYLKENSSADMQWLSLAKNDSANVELKKFNANGMAFSAKNCKNKILVVYQNLLPGHQFYLNGKITPSVKIDDALMGIPITDDDAQVDIIYDPKGVKLLFALSAFCFLCFSFIAFFFSFFEKTNRS